MERTYGDEKDEGKENMRKCWTIDRRRNCEWKLKIEIGKESWRIEWKWEWKMRRKGIEWKKR